MADIILIATIIAFFIAAALLVRALSRVVTDAAADHDADPADFADEADPASGVSAGAGWPASGPERGRPR